MALILKPGNAVTKIYSYRPTSLLPPVTNTLEALLLPSIKECFPVADHQYRFPKFDSILTVLYAISTNVSIELNQNRPCLVALNL